MRILLRNSRIVQASVVGGDKLFQGSCTPMVPLTASTKFVHAGSCFRLESARLAIAPKSHLPLRSEVAFSESSLADHLEGGQRLSLQNRPMWTTTLPLGFSRRLEVQSRGDRYPRPIEKSCLFRFYCFFQVSEKTSPGPVTML